MPVTLAVLLGTDGACGFWSENRRRAGTTTDRSCIDNDTRRAQDVGWCRAAESCVRGCWTALAGSAAFTFSHDWAEGCVAPTGIEVDVLRRAVPVGTPAASRA